MGSMIGSSGVGIPVDAEPDGVGSVAGGFGADDAQPVSSNAVSLSQ